VVVILSTHIVEESAVCRTEAPAQNADVGVPSGATLAAPHDDEVAVFRQRDCRHELFAGGVAAVDQELGSDLGAGSVEGDLRMLLMAAGHGVDLELSGARGARENALPSPEQEHHRRDEGPGCVRPHVTRGG